MKKIEGLALEETFVARLDKMPGKNNTLRVTGKVKYESGGWTAKLVKVVPGGIVGSTLILAIEEKHEGDVSTKPIVEIDVTYTEANSESINRVTIQSGAPEFTKDVEVVH